MPDTIAEAWAAMAANLPVAPGDLLTLVNQVVDELSEAATPAGGSLRQSECSKPFQLEHGFLVVYVHEEQVPGGFTQGVASIEGPGRPPLLIGAQVRAVDHALGVTIPGGGNEFTYWQPGDGPQKEWVLQNLRQRVVEYLSSGQQSPPPSV